MHIMHNVYRSVPERASSGLGSEFLASKRSSNYVLMDRRYQRRDALFEMETPQVSSNSGSPGSPGSGWFRELVQHIAALGKVVTREVPGVEVYSNLSNVSQLSPGIDECPRVGVIFPLQVIIRECEELYGMGVLVTGGKTWHKRGYLVNMLRELGYSYSTIVDAYMSVFPLIEDRYAEVQFQLVDSVLYALNAWVDVSQGGSGELMGYNMEQTELLQAIRSHGISQWCDSMRHYVYGITNQQPPAAIRTQADKYIHEIRVMEQRIVGLVLA